jgi:hypothetical protein
MASRNFGGWGKCLCVAGFFLLASGVVGCGTVKSSDTSTQSQSITISLDPLSASVQVATTKKFTAVVSNTANTAVTWQVSGVPGGDAVHGVIDASGMYTAPSSVPSPPGVTITAVSQAQSAVTATAQVTIGAPAPAVSVTVAPTSTSVQVSHTQSITATVQNDNQNKGVTWALGGTGCVGATCGTLSATSSASGTAITYTAPAAVPAPALVTVTAKSVADTTKTAAVTVTVASAPVVIAVAVTPTGASVQGGRTQSFTATIQNDGQSKGATWALSGAGCKGAACGTLSAAASASGVAIVYTAPTTVPTPGTVTLTAKSVTDTTKTAVATITVTPPPPIVVTVTPTAASVQTGKTQSITATVQNDTLNKGLTWTLTGAGCSGATCGTLSAASSASGAAVTYTAPASVPAPAGVTLTAKSVTDATKTAVAAITVTPPPPIVVTVTPTAASVQTGKTQSVTATVQNDALNKGLTWTLTGAGCSGATCGTLSAASSASGAAITYTAPASVPAPAAVTITAQSVADVSKTAVATFTVVPPPPVIVTVSPTAASVQTGKPQSITATVQNDALNKGLTWTLTGAGCAGATCGTLSAASSASGAAIIYTAPAAVPAPAAVTIAAQSVADVSKTALATLTITLAPPVIVTVNPTAASVQAGNMTNVSATVQNDAQNKGVTWTLTGAGCSGATCGTLSAFSSASGAAITYTAPATAPTPATVTATAQSVADGSKTVVLTITITSVPVTVGISPKRVGLTTGQLQTFVSTVGGSANTAVTWEVDTVPGGNASTGTISAMGVYAPPSAAGTHTVGARSVADSTISATASVAVTDLAGMFTYHNDTSRDGSNTHEYALNTSNVAPATFGKRFACAIDAAAYAQPLWVANVPIGGGTHNILIAATQHDTVYAFDADASPCQTYWTQSLLATGETWVSSGDVGTSDLTPDIGIVGTPVIDQGTKTLYVVSKSKVGSTFHQRLHALSIIDGSEKFSGPQEIAFTSGGITFSPLRQNQRAGLALVNGVVYIAYASHGDQPTYYGWVVGYNATTLAQTGVFNDDPSSGFGGIWMAGGAPAADSLNNLYVITGNGDFDGTTQFGDSFLKLSTGSGIGMSSFFAPSDQASLNSSDADLGSGGAAILVDQPSSPFPRMLIGGGKEGKLYLLNRDSLGGNTGTDSGAVQTFTVGNGIFATPAFWQNTLYLGPINDHVKAYAFNSTTGKFATSPSSQGPGTSGFPGSTPSVSSLGASNGIVWTIQRVSGGAAVLYAFDATNLATELWNSGTNPPDNAGQSVKFTVPTVANGKVYVGTAGEISVYGLSPN